MVFYRLARKGDRESTDGVDEEDGEDGETGEDEEGNLEVLLNLTTEIDGVETALLETGGSVFMMMVVMMMLFGHFFVYCLLFIVLASLR